jgi:lipoprotein Spr
MLHINNFLAFVLLCSITVLSTNVFARNNFSTLTYQGEDFYPTEEFYGQTKMITPKIKNIDNNIKMALLADYSKWRGTRYYLGGTTHSGVDCSALVQHLFKDSLHTSLPRTTSQQIMDGEKININSLRPGDLIFFKISPSDRHVAAYVGSHLFIHASKIRGVTISSLEQPYWADHFETARRPESLRK